MKCRMLVLLAVMLPGLRVWAVTETTIHTFAGGAYSEYPNGGLVFDSSGNAYGTASGGGAGYGTIYELTPSQSGWIANILYEFDDVSGAYPAGPLVFDRAGNLYGTASYGGNMAGICQGSGCGTVFELKRVSSGWRFVVLYTFSGDDDGAHPNSIIFDESGNLYGTTFSGGNLGYGTAFELSPSTERWTESTVYTFAGSNDGANPVSGLTLGATGIFYGTTLFGGAHNCGANNCGTVYKLRKTSSGWKEIILHSFNGSDGSSPFAGLFLRLGTLYGTTSTGGAFNQGTAFSLTQRNYTFIETVLCSFNGTNGTSPVSGMVPDSAGNLYGTTVYGGSNGYGVIFVLRNHNGVWHESVVHDFAGTLDGSQPLGTPTFHAGGLFGTTNGGGEWDAGVAWELNWR